MATCENCGYEFPSEELDHGLCVLCAEDYEPNEEDDDCDWLDDDD